MSKEENYKIDKIDAKILKYLQEDSRRSFQEIARELVVSGGTIHVRTNKMKEAGIIKGSKLIVDHRKLGLEVTSFVGINLVNAREYNKCMEKLRHFPEICELHYTTGQYSIFVKVVTKSTRELHLFLTEKLQYLPEIQSTETLISLDNPIEREPQIPNPEFEDKEK
jgi:Lrp/AsnC family transcriptional regulator, regulator for asnA, asnC and gidA